MKPPKPATAVRALTRAVSTSATWRSSEPVLTISGPELGSGADPPEAPPSPGWAPLTRLPVASLAAGAAEAGSPGTVCAPPPSMLEPTFSRTGAAPLEHAATSTMRQTAAATRAGPRAMRDRSMVDSSRDGPGPTARASADSPLTCRDGGRFPSPTPPARDRSAGPAQHRPSSRPTPPLVGPRREARGLPVAGIAVGDHEVEGVDHVLHQGVPPWPIGTGSHPLLDQLADVPS